jgi:hypothetical protein
MNNQPGLYKAMAWEAPLWLRNALAHNQLPPDAEEDDQYSSEEILTSDEHSLGFV